MSRARAEELLQRLRACGVNPTGISADSRRLAPGEVFAAWPGRASDGRRFIADAVARGASAVLWDRCDGYVAEPLPVASFAVDALRELGGHLAHEIYARPSSALWAVGVTGTNGKTTVTQWLARALGDLGVSCGVIGTLGSGFPGQLRDTGLTTPDALEVHRTIADLIAGGAAAMAMEVSSIGLEQGRVNGVEFDAAVFTNLSRDHLDYHGTMDAYAASKALLFEWPGLRHAVINLDDAFGLTLARRVHQQGMPLIGYTRAASNADAVPGARVLVADDLRASPAGLRFTVVWNGTRREVQVKMVASFNASNLLAVMATLLARDADIEDVLRMAGHLVPPEGRMQLIGGVGEPLVVVDYAHTPDALAKVLDAVSATAAARGGALVCVFGCGGDRDPGKRPLMGEAASQLADRSIITSDNPRSEDPAMIVQQIRLGAGPGAECVIDRGEAIRIAIGEAGPDDVIVIAGKGHEAYQEVHGKRLPFSDVEQARAALHAWNRNRGLDTA